MNRHFCRSYTAGLTVSIAAGRVAEAASMTDVSDDDRNSLQPTVSIVSGDEEVDFLCLFDAKNGNRSLTPSPRAMTKSTVHRYGINSQVVNRGDKTMHRITTIHLVLKHPCVPGCGWVRL